MRTAGARAVLAVVALATAALVLLPGNAGAHSLESSSVKAIVDSNGVHGTISFAVGSLDMAFPRGRRSTAIAPASYARQVTSYVNDHFAVRGSNGARWTQHFSHLVRQTSEGIETITVDFVADSNGANPGDFAVTYDAIIEAVPDHEAVLVVEDPHGTVSTPGVFTRSRHSVAIGRGSSEAGLVDMVDFGFHHVLDGADHLLFLLTLLLPAAFVVTDRRWRFVPRVRPAAHKVVHVVTAFTVGHSITLTATALGWVTVPGRPVEVLIAASVAVSALHGIRPFVRGGEPAIAGVFGLIHGMAFSGILRDLGLEGRTSVLALLAFNVGIELAQLAVTCLVFPSLLVIESQGRVPGRVRTGGCALALAMSVAWMLNRGLDVPDPFAPLERATVDHPWFVVVLFAAAATFMTLRRSATAATSPHVSTAVSSADPQISRSHVRRPRNTARTDATANSIETPIPASIGKPQRD